VNLILLPRHFRVGLVVLFALGVADPSFGADTASRRKVDPRVPRYFVTKEQEARSLAKQLNLQVEPEVWEYFAAGAKGDCVEADRLFNRIIRKWRDEQKGSAISGPLFDAELACECFTSMESKFAESFAHDIIDSIPRGSIYFGGTDPGRGLITAFVKSLPEAKPFFVLSQNPLGSKPYLDYVRAMYGGRLHIPSTADWQRAFDDYAAAAKARLDTDKLKPGENVEEDEGGKLRPVGNVAWMEVNALLAKMIFDRNPRHEFYIEVEPQTAHHHPREDGAGGSQLLAQADEAVDWRLADGGDAGERAL
jgi:hypothetical protein